MHDFVLAAIALATLGALFDWRTGHIPNWLTVGALLAFPLAHGATEWAQYGFSRAAVMEVVYSLGGALACGIVPVLLLAKNAIGAGDVKLLAALGAVLGPTIGIEGEFYTFVAAGLVIPFRLAFHGNLFRSVRNAAVAAVSSGSRARRELAPHMAFSFRLGPAILVGAVVSAVLHWRAV